MVSVEVDHAQRITSLRSNLRANPSADQNMMFYWLWLSRFYHSILIETSSATYCRLVYKQADKFALDPWDPCFPSRWLTDHCYHAVLHLDRHEVHLSDPSSRTKINNILINEVNNELPVWVSNMASCSTCEEAKSRVESRWSRPLAIATVCKWANGSGPAHLPIPLECLSQLNIRRF